MGCLQDSGSTGLGGLPVPLRATVINELVATIQDAKQASIVDHEKMAIRSSLSTTGSFRRFKPRLKRCNAIRCDVARIFAVGWFYKCKMTGW